MERVVDPDLHLLLAGLQRAEGSSRCLRRPCAAQAILLERQEVTRFAVNGPARSVGCSGVRGACGCEHAEARLIVDMLEEELRPRYGYAKWRLLTSLSPCTACAHLIVRSRMFTRVTYLRPLEHDLRGIDILTGDGLEVSRA